MKISDQLRGPLAPTGGPPRVSIGPSLKTTTTSCKFFPGWWRSREWRASASYAAMVVRNIIEVYVLPL